jgi:acyl carrier protein phosphodiesterase
LIGQFTLKLSIFLENKLLNYLAHIYLSGDHQALMIGNFIADAVKGKQFESYPEEIQKGIRMHRSIDTFTDTHEVTRRSRERLFDDYRHYSGVIVDIFYDHFLARHWDQFHDTGLEQYTKDVYYTLGEFSEVLPPRINHMLEYMIPQNWLLNYKELPGIARVLKGMSSRASFDSGMDRAIENLTRDYKDFEQDFFDFFPDLQQYVKDNYFRP